VTESRKNAGRTAVESGTVSRLLVALSLAAFSVGFATLAWAEYPVAYRFEDVARYSTVLVVGRITSVRDESVDFEVIRAVRGAVSARQVRVELPSAHLERCRRTASAESR
jgi:hypothetical protein